MRYVLGIDPGSEKSAYCMVDALTMRPLSFGKVQNIGVLNILRRESKSKSVEMDVVIEQVVSYGMPVGREVFQTCEWIGRYKQVAYDFCVSFHDMPRKEVCIELCHSAKAGDSNVRRALIDLFAEHDLKNGKGTKNNPDWFSGFSADMWSAYAIAYTFIKHEELGASCRV